jgi:succinate dehydrogenase/fumarate reductase cytochrome b subunit
MSILVSLQRALGLVLALFAGFHLWVQWPALAGRDAWLERVRVHGIGMGVGLGVVVLFALHGVLGLVRVQRARAGGDFSARPRFQALTGGLLLLFLIHHLSHVWPLPDASDASWLGSYERLWSLLGRPINLVSYVLGCGALACHVTHGLASMLQPRVPATLRTLFHYAAGVSAFALFVLYMQLVGRFALGEPMLPTSHPEFASELRE